jgi:predicted unusual protein kinase regulating ubiquinone biosynthesis (AarF/ABC1/UbiB family)
MKSPSTATCGRSTCGKARDAPVNPAEIVRLMWRSATIVAVVGACALRLAVVWTFCRGDARARALGEIVGGCCETLGPTFIKLAQILSTRPDLIHPELAAALGRLQSAVRHIPHRLVPRLLHAAYGRPVDAVFDTLDFAPLGSGSIAQVHRARLKDGRTVAVKIRRPGIERRVRLICGYC